MNKYRIGVFVIATVSFFVLSLYLFHPADLWWDSSVYVAMGKYIFSFGKAGIWEASRPLVWAAILGFYWMIGLDPVLFGTVTNILFNVGCIILTYLIGRKLFDDKIGFVSALLLTFSPTFFRFTTILYTEISSLFFVLLGFYLFLLKKYTWSGFVLGIAIMSRFFFWFFAAAILIFQFVKAVKKKAEKKSLCNVHSYGCSYNSIFYTQLFYVWQCLISVFFATVHNNNI